MLDGPKLFLRFYSINILIKYNMFGPQYQDQLPTILCYIVFILCIARFSNNKMVHILLTILNIAPMINLQMTISFFFLVKTNDK